MVLYFLISFFKCLIFDDTLNRRGKYGNQNYKFSMVHVPSEKLSFIRNTKNPYFQLNFDKFLKY